MQFFTSINFYSKCKKKLHISLEHFITILHFDFLFEWTPELNKLFNEIETSLSKDAELSIPNTTDPFYLFVDATPIGLRAI